MWPWSYPKCDRTLQKAQEISGCDVTEHFELHAHQGRGATEIDVVEVMPGTGPLPVVPKGVKLPYNSMTLQVGIGNLIASKENFLYFVVNLFLICYFYDMFCSLLLEFLHH